MLFLWTETNWRMTATQPIIIAIKSTPKHTFGFIHCYWRRLWEDREDREDREDKQDWEDNESG